MPPRVEQEIDLDLVKHEFPDAPDGTVYLNTGSCGRKPRCVLEAIQKGWEELNVNPTWYTHLNETPAREARSAAAELLAVNPDNLLITHNTSDGLQLIMQSFLLSPGDELVTTDQEHGIVKTLCRYLEETRGVVVRKWHVEAFDGSEALCRGIYSLVNEKTKLVEVSEIGCLTGWRPNLSLLAELLEAANVPLLVDGAHAPGHGPCRPANFPLWVGSGHKWLGGPNGTGLAYIAPHLVPELRPLLLGDKHYNFSETQLARFEAQGTTDVVRLLGLAAACRLHIRLNPESLAARQRTLVRYLRERLEDLPAPQMRTPDVAEESTGMITFTWPSSQVKVADLRDALWTKHRIWIQPDFHFGDPGHGMRVACHCSNTESDIDKLISALSEFIKPNAS